ncbi:MAG: AAA family ATPase [Lactococcus cremoris]
MNPVIQVLAGKNESGKSTILEALELFDEEKTLSRFTSPIGTKKESEIFITFEVLKEEIEQELGEIYSKSISISNSELITIKKDMSGYTIDDGIKLPEKTQKIENEEIKALENNIIKIIKESGLKDATKEHILNQELTFKDYEYDIPEWLKNPTNANIYGNIYSLNEPSIETFSKILELIEQFRDTEFIEKKFVNNLIKRNMPYFVKFDSFNDVFPDSVSIDSIKTNPVILDLEEVSDFKIDEIISDDSQIQANHENQVNTNFSKVFEDYWTQDDIKLVVRKDGDKINFWIEENHKLFKPSQRSKGQQWYLSFYIKVVAKMQETTPNVILIDEPGLYLHAKAQKDLLKVLERQFSSNVLVFSTHSPYLIEENRLNNIRLVEKIEGSTTIVSKPWAKIEDKETLTSILTAIGLGLGDSISDRFKNNVICEGMEEVLYLQAFQRLTNNDEDINFINGNGAAKLEFFGRILEAWELNVKYLFDNDIAGKRAGNKVLRDNPSALVNFVSDVSGESTVDLISIDDFKNIVLEDSSINVIKNSDYIKNEKLDKVILARKFLNHVKGENIELSTKSIDNIKKLMDKLYF